MGLKFTHVRGAETYATNHDGADYLDTAQFTSARSELHKLTISPLSGMLADVYVWIFDLSAGSAASVMPVAVRLVPSGLADSWDMGNGGLRFNNGIFIACAENLPADDTTTPTAATLAGSNKVIIRADFRVGS